MSDTNKYRDKLTDEQYNICFLKGTEPPFSGKYTDNKEKGTYYCMACGNKLFSSATKFDSGTGWPSFFDTMNKDVVKFEDDYRYGIHRIEVQCKNCGAHLGHLFDSSSHPTGKHYCINSLALDFKPEKKK